MGNMFKGSLSDHIKMQLKAATKFEAPHKKLVTTTRNAKGMMSGSTWLKGVERKQDAEYQAEMGRLATMDSAGMDTTGRPRRRRQVSLIAPASSAGVTLERV